MKKIGETMVRLDLDDIYIYLRNREPLLLIDQVIVEPGKHASMVKTMREDEWYFACHFPGDPVMPGVLQLETMFQTSALAIKVLDGNKGKTTNLVRIDSARFLKHIRPGDTIKVDAEIERFKRGIVTVHAVIFVETVLCSDARFVLAVLDDISDMCGRTK